MTDVTATAQAFREAAADIANAYESELCQRCSRLLLAAAEQREQLRTLTAERDGWKDQVEDEHGDLAQCREQRQAFREQIATLTAERDEARATVQLLCDLISKHPDPALAELLPDILDPRERTE